MTAADLARALADEIDRREAVEKENAELRAKLACRVAEQAAVPEWLRVKEAAAYIRRPKSFLDKDRVAKPPRIQFRQEADNGLVLYSRAKLDEYVAARIKKIAA